MFGHVCHRVTSLLLLANLCKHLGIKLKFWKQNIFPFLLDFSCSTVSDVLFGVFQLVMFQLFSVNDRWGLTLLLHGHAAVSRIMSRMFFGILFCFTLLLLSVCIVASSLSLQEFLLRLAKQQIPQRCKKLMCIQLGNVLSGEKSPSRDKGYSYCIQYKYK